MEIIPDKRKVVGLVEQAYKGEICLPNFQRDFVWTREEVADLMRSIIRGYFIGSLLLLRCDKENPPFAPIFLRGAKPAYRDARPELLVLDGQQRLSSLIYALTAPDLSLKDSSQRRWFFLNLDLLLSEPDSDEIIFDRAKRELRGLDTPDAQYKQRILPCTALLTQQSFYAWRDGFEDWLRSNAPDQLGQYRSEWRDGWTSAATAFQTFEAPLVELPRVDESDSESIGRVCAIFEKLNSTGVDLSVYDLLTARLYRSGIRLHDLWAEPARLIRGCGRGRRARPTSTSSVCSCFARSLFSVVLTPSRGYSSTCCRPTSRPTGGEPRPPSNERLRSPNSSDPTASESSPRNGFRDSASFPSWLRCDPKSTTRKLGEQERADLRRWYWCNVFMERYSSAVESKSRKDYLEMTRHWFDGKPEPEVFREAQNWIGAPGFRIRGSASYASAVYSGVFCLLALRNARDWRRGEDIRLQELQDHHIFPQAYLKRHEITKRVDVNTIANRTLISNETNGKIKDKAPAEYLRDRNIFPSGGRPELLGPHFIDDTTLPMLLAALEELPDAEPPPCTAVFSKLVKPR